MYVCVCVCVCVCVLDFSAEGYCFCGYRPCCSPSSLTGGAILEKKGRGEVVNHNTERSVLFRGEWVFFLPVKVLRAPCRHLSAAVYMSHVMGT